MSIFDDCKRSLDIVEVAQQYGLSLNRSKKAICPFHNDRNPSMSFKNRHYKCFSCGASGSVIDLVQQLLGLPSPLEAVKVLNSDYGLGLQLDEPPDKEKIKQKQREADLYKDFEQWEEQAHKIIAAYHRQLIADKRNYSPKSSSEDLSPLFLEAINNLDYTEYILDCISNADFQAKVDFYKTHREWVKRIAETREDRDSKTAEQR